MSLFPSPGTWIVDNIGIQEVQIGFDEPVTIPPNAIVVWAVGAGTLSPGTDYVSSLDAATNIVSVTFTSPIRDDRLTIVVDYTVTDLAGNELDGNIVDPANAALPSGDGQRGGQAVFRYNILQGDANRDGVVDTSDGQIIQASLGRSLGDPDFDPSADLNNDGIVNVLGIATFTLARGRSLPATDQVPPLVTQIRPSPSMGSLNDLWDDPSHV